MSCMAFRERARIIACATRFNPEAAARPFIGTAGRLDTAPRQAILPRHASSGRSRLTVPTRRSSMPQSRKSLCAVAMLALAVSNAACAHSPLVTQSAVEIFDRTEGRVLPMYWHEGRRYVVGKPGNEYAIRVRNGAGGRVLAVMSVDGVNVITGDTASTQQSGYVLAPYETAEIAGWRTSLSHTAAFYFTALPDSYAARTGRPDNVGVIGVAIFAEKQRPIALNEPRREIGR